MELLKLFITLFILQALCISPRSMQAAAKNSILFREYIGAQFNNVKFSDVPINPDVEFHFILAFAIDYSSPSTSSNFPTNGKFNIFWDEQYLTPAHVSSIKSRHSNVKFHLDGIDVDYEQFSDDPDTYTHCIGRLITTLKKNGVISYTSIAPYGDDQAQSHYKALWRSYGHLIDYSSNYEGGKVLVSFLSHESDDSLANGFRYEKKAQSLLASAS
ncbi:Chitinase 1 [Vitis vinifera]|uniref:Chitinase 1 n=1 Tax=Vitis vinifera TaxID=29760 RepID=A0A438KP74_VITVI|nr:Chitinase 1 [Vitis vinifera]